ncbi:cobyrinate a,c-diamide synthase [Alisedimentitalea sp. MJ-SS2]|uniref:cobyrinate a,c-diamide synthase n=1 Tax=Aliisedimentitalea sp. MJ-SS2 TaxID=3049795 RepID=UPI0029099308|nr:cobyrinate a,c-diamide synthase [Alisedimentitalea sp. MJ-SS2]MDU8926657.1 cobyrinate a,c-diamide synthase [Alisedimentitalea sp. MJ-SS2]
MPGVLIAAPGSGAGKTTVTLALLRLLKTLGHDVRGAKSGPDYIDPRFHEAACGAECLNLDAWAMVPDRLRILAAGNGFLVVEGAMGLFDGTPPAGKGAAADVAQSLAIPVVLVVNASHMAQSVAALVRGFAAHDPRITIAGVILNNIGSDRHERLLRLALEPLGVPVLAALHRNPDLTLPSRHLGLVQAGERADLDAFLDKAAIELGKSLDVDRLLQIAQPVRPAKTPTARLRPPAQTIAIARDQAFAFAYPHMLNDWRTAGAELRFFSPLADDPVPEADFVYLPGGYPELHAGHLSTAKIFLTTLRNAAQCAEIYGECGGYMTLGETLIDAQGVAHAMAGLLPLATSFEKRRLHLGYRSLTALRGPFQGSFNGHEFHYATTLKTDGTPLFRASDAEGMALPDMGLVNGKVAGSFAHLIDVKHPT